jgi:hypothetical protein
MSLKVFYEILNQRDTPAMFADVFSNRPAFGFNGRIFISTDTKQIYRDYGTFWDLIADAGAGSGTLQSVCTNGNTTTTDVTLVSPGRLFIGALSNGGVLFPAGGSGQVSQSANLFWDNTNNRLGINTNTPTATFDIHSTSSVMMQLNQTGLNNSLQSFLLQGVGKWRIGNFYNAGDNDFYIYDVLSGTPRAYFTNTGYTIFPTNLIIGSSNRSSAYGMDVYVSANLQSTLRVVGGSTFLSQIGGTSAVFSSSVTAAGNNQPTLGFQLTTTTSTSTPRITSDSVNATVIRTGASGSPVVINNFANSSELVRFTDAGNVGIGTSSPTAAAGLAFVLNSGASQGRICIKTSTTGDASGDGLQIGMSGNDAFIEQRENADLSFATNASERMRITSGGNLLIGTTTDVSSPLVVNNGTGQLRIGVTNGRRIDSYNSGSLANMDLYTTGLYISYLGTGTVTATSGILSTVSDMNLKNEDGFIINALEKVLKLKPRYFHWKKESGLPTDLRQLGFYAQEVNEALGEETSNTPKTETDKWGIYDRGMIAFLTAAIQEQQLQIEELKAKYI